MGTLYGKLLKMLEQIDRETIIDVPIADPRKSGFRATLINKGIDNITS